MEKTLGFDHELFVAKLNRMSAYRKWSNQVLIQNLSSRELSLEDKGMDNGGNLEEMV